MNTKPNFYDVFYLPKNMKQHSNPNGDTLYSIDYIDRDYEGYDYDEYDEGEEETPTND